MCHNGRVVAKNVIFNMAAAAILDFFRIRVLGVNVVHCPGTLFSVSVSNLVRIRSKMAELWSFNGFQNGGPGPPTKSTSWPEVCVKMSFQ